MFRQRVRIFFNKEGLSRFLGHHDLMRLFERALRRAGLPLSYSAGYNPRPQISFPLALALGYESQAEVCEVELVRWISPRRAREGLGKELPEGIGVGSVRSVSFADKAAVRATEFSVEFEQPPPRLGEVLAGFLARAEVLVRRTGKSKSKDINVREYVDYARLDGPRLLLGLKVSPRGAVRPEEVLCGAFDRPVETFGRLRIVRTRLDLAPPP
jgi:radical SAM-linked protein